MKKNWVYRLLIALVCVLVFMACDPIEGDINEVKEKAGVGDTFTLTVSDINDLIALLPVQTGGKTPAKAGKLIVSFDFGNMLDSTSNWFTLLGAIKTAGKYVELDLSACEITGTVFDPYFAGSTGKDRIVSIMLPKDATSIAPDTVGSSPAFSYFSNLKTAGGKNITNIGGYAFYNCTSLSGVNFSNTLIIGNYAFSGCENLSSMNFPNAETIGWSAFDRCHKLSSVYLPAAKYIKNNAFLYSGITNIIMPVAEDIEGYAFQHCKNLTTVTFPQDATIAGNPFLGCVSLVTINLQAGTGLHNVFNSSLYGSALYRGDLGINAELISWPAFQGNWGGLSIIKIGELALAQNPNLKNFRFSTVTEVGSQAFYGCTELLDVELPNATIIGMASFASCTNLNRVDFSKVGSIYHQVFAYTGAVSLEITMGTSSPALGVNIFEGVTETKNVTVKVPTGATGYDVSWQNDFKGSNSYINLTIKEES